MNKSERRFVVGPSGETEEETVDLDDQERKKKKTFTGEGKREFRVDSEGNAEEVELQSPKKIADDIVEQIRRRRDEINKKR